MLKTRTLAMTISTVLLASPVFAQQPPTAPNGYTAPSGNVAPEARGPEARGMRRVREAHDRLGITPAQQPQWDALVATMRDNARAMRASPAVQALRSGHLDAVQALRAAADVARLRADAMQRMIPAVEALYGVLSPEQRQIADREVGLMVMPGHRPG